MMEVRRLIYVSNAFDESTRREREVTTDSPAASRKTFATCVALRRAGVRAVVLSMGRGRADSRLRYHRGIVRRVDGVPVVYLPFVRIRIVSELLSMAGLVAATLRMCRLKGPRTFFIYNRTPAYLPVVMTAALMGERRVLDLEDGDLAAPGLATRLRTRTFQRFCRQGTVLAASALGERNVDGPTFCYYGAVAPRKETPGEFSGVINVLLGGTVAADTGAELLAGAIEMIRRDGAAWAKRLRLVVTGKGESLPRFTALAAAGGYPEVAVPGRIGDAEYDALLDTMNVGLALKANAGPLAKTTFPSKVIEMSMAGLLVISTDISDVRRVFGDDGALFLTKDTADELIAALRWVVEHPRAAREMAQRGMGAVQNLCDVHGAGASLARFLFPAEAR